MTAENLNDLRAFVAVAQARSFTRAAAQLGMSRSALSHAMTALEARLNVRLLTRTTRSVATSEAGARLLGTLTPMLNQLDAELTSLRSLRGQPAGRVRITATDHAIVTTIWPRLRKLLGRYPDIQVELSVDYGLTDIVTQHFDAGVRDGDVVDKDMIAVRIGPDLRMTVVGAPTYFAKRSLPKKPQDLTGHDCINLRLPTRDNLYAWEFQKGRRKLNVHVQGQLIFNRPAQMLNAALAGFGLAYLLEDVVRPYLATGQLKRVLDDWCPSFPGYHLYYPSRRQPSPAFVLVVDALRYRS